MTIPDGYDDAVVMQSTEHGPRVLSAPRRAAFARELVAEFDMLHDGVLTVVDVQYRVVGSDAQCLWADRIDV